MDATVQTEVKGVFTGDRWRPAVFGKTLAVVAPAKGEAFTHIAAAEAGRLLSKPAVADHADGLTRLEARDTVWSLDGNPALRVSRGIKAGPVYINSFGAGGGIDLPFGGMKTSGHGREKGFAALHDVSRLRTTIIKHG